MPNTKISNLTNAGALTGTEVAPIVQSSNTVKVSTQNIADLAPVPNATKISALSNAGALSGTENVIITQGGTTVKTTTQAIANLGGGGTPKLFNGSYQISFGTPSLNTTIDTFTGLNISIQFGGSILRFQCNQFTGSEIVSIGQVINSTNFTTGVSQLIFAQAFMYNAGVKAYEFQFQNSSGTGQNLSLQEFNTIGLLCIYQN